MSGIVRAFKASDIDDFVTLCHEHAIYERADWDAFDRRPALLTHLLADDRIHAWVVDGQDELAGFAVASLEWSTWDAAHYLHLDCLYLRPAYRGLGHGRALMQAAASSAVKFGAVNLQWQTPEWNDTAIGFYRRLGASASRKLRFRLSRDAIVALGSGQGLPDTTTDA